MTLPKLKDKTQIPGRSGVFTVEGFLSRERTEQVWYKVPGPATNRVSSGNHLQTAYSYREGVETPIDPLEAVISDRPDQVRRETTLYHTYHPGVT